MSTDLVPASDGGGSLAEKIAYARALAAASLLPRAYQGNPGNVLLAVELGAALGIPAIQAINGVHVVEGRPTASADLIASLVRRAGHRLRIAGDDTRAVAQLIRADDPEYTFEAVWTMDRARAAGLAGKGVWKSYPGAMLKARAITEVARMGASDALYGVIYTPEEIGADVPAAGEPRRAAAPRERLAAVLRPADPEPLDAEIVEVVEDAPAPTVAELRDLAIAMHAAGVPDADRLAWLTESTGRLIASSRDLTRAEYEAAMATVGGAE